MTAAQGTISQAGTHPHGEGLIREFRTLWRDLCRAMFDSYHPERHYMRGPGPACAAKRSRQV